jgi:DNA-binding transcriptional regulator YiaG
MAKRKRKVAWDAGRIHGLRGHLGLTQAQMAEEMGTRQQTISEWETGQYKPRGTSAQLLTLTAERAGFVYEAKGAEAGEEEHEG